MRRLAVLALLMDAVACQSPSRPAPPQPELLLLSGPLGSIVTMHVDGTHRVVLPQTGRTPSWTSDGRIVFVSPRSQVWLMDADGEHAHQVGDLPFSQGGSIVKPQMAANGTIAFSNMEGRPSQTADNPGPQNGTWFIRQDGSGLRMVVKHCNMASLATSGAWLSCTKEIGGHREIWRVDIDGSHLRQLTFPTTDSGYPDGNASSISPDGRTIAFFSGRESSLGTGGLTQDVLTWGNRNVAVIPAGGGARRTITDCTPATTAAQVQALMKDGCLAADNPAWSRDGTRIVYDRGSPNPANGGTWEIGLDAKGNRQISRDTRGAGNVPLR